MFKLKVMAILAMLILICTGICMAEENSTEVSDVQAGWAGTWICGVNTLILNQNGDLVQGTYEKPEDNLNLTLEGNVTENGTVLSGTWLDSATFRFILSEDGKFFNGTYESKNKMANEGYSDNFWNATLALNETDSENPWTGSWDTGMNTFTNLTQEGNKVTGTYITPGSASLILEGTVSDDGSELSGSYTNSGLYVFTLSEDGKTFNGTWGYGSDDSSLQWNGTLSI